MLYVAGSVPVTLEGLIPNYNEELLAQDIFPLSTAGLVGDLPNTEFYLLLPTGRMFHCLVCSIQSPISLE